MGELIFRQFKLSDGMALKDRPNQKGLKGHKDYEKWLKYNMENGPCWTGELDGVVIGCGGIVIHWPGFGEAWLIFPENVKDNHKPIEHRIAKKMLYEMIKDNDLKRTEISPRCDWPPGLSYARFLGFKVEGKRRKYMPDADGTLVDCFLMSIIRE